MKNKFIAFYAFFASVAFVFSVVFFAANVYKEYSQGRARANQRYDKLVEDLKIYASADRRFSQNALENIKNAIGNFNDFSFIQLTLDDAEILKYPKNATAASTVSNLTKSYDADIFAQSGRLKIICNVYLLRPASIYYYAKISFLIILIVTTTTIILIFYINSIENQIPKNDGESEDENENIFPDENAEEKEKRIPIFSENSILEEDSDEENLIQNSGEENNDAKNSGEQDNVARNDGEKNENPQNENQNSNSKDFFDDKENFKKDEKNSINAAFADDSAVASDVIAENHDSAPNSALKNLKENDNAPQTDFQNEKTPSENQNAKKIELPDFETPVKLEQNGENNPTGLFNPVTGLGWESYLQTRLENEISRAISSEIDLAIFLIELPQTRRESPEMKKISEYLTLQFQFKDLLFEYEKNSVAAIKISMNLDEALNFADKIYSELTKIADGKECFMGISTRNIRIVSAERLMSEAQAALKHAKEDGDSPIIAFRVDAGKYREYMEQN